MKELYNDMDDKSRDAVRNIRIAFDDKAWDKMEVLLNDEDRKPGAQVISNKLLQGKDLKKNSGWLQLFLVFFLTGAVVLFIKNNNTLQNKALPIANNNKASDINARKSNKENIAGRNAKAEQLINEYLRKQQPEKNNNNKNFKPKATIDKIPTLSLSTSRSYKIDDLFKANIDGQRTEK